MDLRAELSRTAWVGLHGGVLHPTVALGPVHECAGAPGAHGDPPVLHIDRDAVVQVASGHVNRELGGLDPARAFSAINPHAALKDSITATRGEWGADDRDVTVYRDRPTELIALLERARHELLVLEEERAAALEDVDTAATRARIVVELRTDDEVLAVVGEVDIRAEVIELLHVARSQPAPIAPSARGALVDVHDALVEVGDVRRRCADDEELATDRK